MHTILGASGPIGNELAHALKGMGCDKIRLVSRTPFKLNQSDHLYPADLLHAQQTLNAVKGSEVVYLTAGLPLDSQRWCYEWPIIMRNVIDACAFHQAKLVFFDNTYMYPQTSEPQTETSEFKPNGAKGRVRAHIASQLLAAIDNQQVEAMICRAPEFYGPGKTQSITNATILHKLRAGRKAMVFLRDDTRRTLIYPADAAKAMALLGNTADAYQQTWHLPCDDNRLTFKQLIQLSEQILQTRCEYKRLTHWQLRLLGVFNKQISETVELLPRYNADNIFVSDKFKRRFPDFTVTRYQQGLTETLRNDC